MLIVVEDRNDVIPHFDEDLYEFSIIGTREVLGEVGFIYALDEDSGQNGYITYYIESATNDGRSFTLLDTISCVVASYKKLLLFPVKRKNRK